MITAAGVGSGLDIEGLVTQLVEPGLADPQLLAGLGNRQLVGDRLQDHLQPLFRHWGALQAFGNLRAGWLPSRSGRVHGTCFLVVTTDE